MQVVTSKIELSQLLDEYRRAGKSIGFVPTMGALHEGHLSLMRICRENNDIAVASIFVNPTQFNDKNDLANYPRTLEADCAKLTGFADIIFTPSVAEIYPQEQSMTIQPPPIANVLCGASRLSHFAGVATVVMKLFNIVQPQVAVFGKKDFQQLFIIKEMVSQFNLPIEIIAGETVREASGLALSSRNGYLTAAQRAAASQLNSALQSIVNQIKIGNKNFVQLEQQATTLLTKQGWEVDYISIRSSTTLQPASQLDKNLIVLGAAKIANKTSGQTRLIDNVEFRITD